MTERLPLLALLNLLVDILDVLSRLFVFFVLGNNLDVLADQTGRLGLQPLEPDRGRGHVDLGLGDIVGRALDVSA